MRQGFPAFDFRRAPEPLVLTVDGADHSVLLSSNINTTDAAVTELQKVRTSTQCHRRLEDTNPLGDCLNFERDA